MMNWLVAVLIVGTTALSPVAASAMQVPHAAEIAPLVQTLNDTLTKLNALDTTHPHISVVTSYGTAPFTTLFMLDGLTGTESIDFGDGHTTGSAGCEKNVLGWCNLGSVIGHTYAFPALYKVVFYQHIDKVSVRILRTTYVLVM